MSVQVKHKRRAPVMGRSNVEQALCNARSAVAALAYVPRGASQMVPDPHVVVSAELASVIAYLTQEIERVAQAAR